MGTGLSTGVDIPTPALVVLEADMTLSDSSLTGDHAPSVSYYFGAGPGYDAGTYTNPSFSMPIGRLIPFWMKWGEEVFGGGK